MVPNMWTPVRWSFGTYTIRVIIQRDPTVRKYGVYDDIGNVLNHDGGWEWEPQPSSRDEDFLKRCRFDSFEQAVEAFNTAKE